MHSATGETPYDLHRKATSPNLFPNLQLCHSDVTVTTPIPKCKIFEVGEQVLVYDKMAKINTVGNDVLYLFFYFAEAIILQWSPSFGNSVCSACELGSIDSIVFNQTSRLQFATV